MASRRGGGGLFRLAWPAAERIRRQRPPRAQWVVATRLMALAVRTSQHSPTATRRAARERRAFMIYFTSVSPRRSAGSRSGSHVSGLSSYSLALFFAPALRVFSRPEGYDAPFTLQRAGSQLTTAVLQHPGCTPCAAHKSQQSGLRSGTTTRVCGAPLECRDRLPARSGSILQFHLCPSAQKCQRAIYNSQ